MTETYGEWRERVGLPSLAINVDPVEAQRTLEEETWARLVDERAYHHKASREITRAINSIRAQLGYCEENCSCEGGAE